MMGWEAPPSHRLHNYKLGINASSDMSPDEFAKTHLGYTKPEMPWGNLKNLGTHGSMTGSAASDDFRPDSVAIYTMQFAAKAVAQTAVEFRPSDGPASKASAVLNVVTVCDGVCVK